MAVLQDSKILASDVSEAIKSITRDGTTFTYTCLDGSTGTFTQQDNDTTNASTIRNFVMAVKAKYTSSGKQIGGFALTNSSTGGSGGSTAGYHTTLKLPSGGKWRWAYYDAYSTANANCGESSGGSSIATITGGCIAIAVRIE